jgi:serine/threonine protein kinase
MAEQQTSANDPDHERAEQSGIADPTIDLPTARHPHRAGRNMNADQLASDQQILDETLDHLPADTKPLIAATSRASLCGTTFGDYQLITEIARGGMGVVFKALQLKLNRIVALKMILSGTLAATEEIQRFKAEAEAAANLDHPGIVPIYDIGKHQGYHYFSMGFVDGESLQDKLREGPIDPCDAANICREIAEAIAYAHDQGVIHRDLKPSNVLLDNGGRVRVADFGLAKRVDSGADLTRSGAVIGTPNYMSPEQAQGSIAEIGVGSDVYSLGAILYCSLTGRPPFQTANTVDTLFQVVHQVPAPPRSLNPQLPKDLQTICLKCLEKNTSDRYPSARDLADELDRFLRGDPIQARPITPMASAWRWCRRNKAVAILFGLVVSAAVLLFVASIGEQLVDTARKAGRAFAAPIRTQNNLDQIEKALNNYHSRYPRLPSDQRDE